MSEFVTIAPEEYLASPFRMIGKEWMLIAAEKEGKTNAMTAAWGGLGVMWSKNVVFAVIRPHRYTREFVDASDCFSLNFFDASFHDRLGYFGTVSGRNEDKIAKTGLTVLRGDAPYFGEASTAFLCRKLYAQPYAPEFFIDRDCDSTWYPEKDYHIQYIGEVVRILVKN